MPRSLPSKFTSTEAAKDERKTLLIDACLKVGTCAVAVCGIEPVTTQCFNAY